MPSKIYKCCKCGKIFEGKEKPIRLTMKLYGIGRYQQYAPVYNYDFCERCYSKIDNWIRRKNNVRSEEK